MISSIARLKSWSGKGGVWEQWKAPWSAGIRTPEEVWGSESPVFSTLPSEKSCVGKVCGVVQTLFEVQFGVSWAANPAFLDAFHTKCAQNIHETSKDRSKSPASSRAAVDVSRWLLDESGGLCLASITRRAWRSAWQRSFKTSPAWFARLSEYVAVAHRLPPGRVTGHLHLERQIFSAQDEA